MAHYYDNDPTSDLEVNEIDINILGNDLSFILPSGVFSKKRLDRGTEVLIKYADIKEQSNILDMGCGWGPIGISLGKKYDCTVTMADINKRAVSFANKNAIRNGIRAEVLVSDSFDNIEGNYDTILSNLPQSAGKTVCFDIIERSYDHLSEGGSLQVVVRKNKGGKLIEEKLKEVFGSFTVLAKKSGYWVYKAVKITP